MGGINKVNYQTTDKEQGVFPTIEWFEKIKEHVDFIDKSVVDYGCAQGVMCILAKRSGASKVLGIDQQEENIDLAKILAGDLDINFIHGDIEGKRWDHFDIKIFSMIVHWIGKEEVLNQSRYSKKMVFIFREKDPDYEIPVNGKWFPSLIELDKTLQGFSRKHSEVLMEDHGRPITLAIYDRKNR